MVQLGARKRARGTQSTRTAHRADFEVLCETYGKEFAKRLKRHFGAELLGKKMSELTPNELAELRPKLARSADYKKILTEVSTEFAKVLKGSGKVANLPKGFKSADAVAKIILYSERSMVKNALISAKFESRWREAVPEIRRTMQERMLELNAERERILRLKKKFPKPIPVKYDGKPVYRGDKPVVRTVPGVPVELKNKIARYSMLIKNEGKLLELLRKSFAEAGNMREFFEKVFYFDPNHVGILSEAGNYARQSRPRTSANAIDRGINRMLGKFQFVGEMGIRMKFLPNVLFSTLRGRVFLQNKLSAGVVEKMIVAQGGSASIMERAVEASASAAKNIHSFAGKKAGAKTTQSFFTKEVLAKLRAQGVNVKGVSTAMAVFAGFSLMYMLEGTGTKTTPKSVPKKVK